MNRQSDFPERPDRPEFWRLAYIVSHHDARLDGITDPDAKDQEWQRIMGQYLPTDVASYVSVQRGMRAAGVATRGELAARFNEVARAAAVWLDGFAAGAAYQSTKRQGDKSP